MVVITLMFLCVMSLFVLKAVLTEELVSPWLPTAVPEFEKNFIVRLSVAVKEYKAIITGPVTPSVYKLYDYYRKILYIKHYQYDILSEIKIITDSIVDELNSSLDIAILYDFT